MTKPAIRLLLLGLPFLAACSTLPVSSTSGTDAPAGGADQRQMTESVPLPAPAPEPVIEYGNFTRDQLELALLSELGSMRGYLPQAAEGFYNLAMETRDPGVLRRAIEYASAIGNLQALGELAEQWLALDTEALDPHLILGYQFLEQNLFVRALPHLEKVLALGGQVDFTAMSARTLNLENRQRDVLINRLNELVGLYPAEQSLYYALAQLYDQNSNDQNARLMLEQSRQKFGDSPRAILIEAQLLQNSGQADQAEQLLANAVLTFPDHRLLRYSYAQVLVQQEKLDEASVQFTELMRQEPQDMETLYSLILINLELDQLVVAEAQLRDLLASGYRTGEAYYYLGYVLEQRGALAQALENYQAIPRQSNAFLNAQRQIMRLLVTLERFDDASVWTERMSRADTRLAPMYPALQAEALLTAGYDELAGEVLDKAITDFPDNTDLLFTRTLLNERQQRLDDVERDLRRIIGINPMDARALNHLGYSLTVNTNRYQEALELIERAIEIAPDDPAIIDSLGWVQFKLGYLDDALHNLQIAYAAFPDPEVAAHLGEVLWMMGRQDDARIIWNEALATAPDSEHVLEAMQRLTGETR